MKKPSIGPVPRPGNPRDSFDASIKETLEILTARRVPKIERLADDASTADLVAKVNEILERLQ